MPTTTETYVLLRAFTQELVRCGMRAACTSPGSRSAPLVLTLAGEPGLRCYSHIDERCSGFFALGLAKASGLPVAVTCTSGTAAAQLLAPAVEAREARVPLLILTADRPAELRENGAGQAIDQLKIFGSAARWFVEVELPEASDSGLRWIRTLACRAYAATLEGSPGAVHLNFPLREPLVSDEALPEDATARPDGAPYVLRLPARWAPRRGMDGGAEQQRLAERVGAARRGVIVAGRHERRDGLDEAAAELAARAGWPLLADPLSRARRGPAAIAHYDAFLRDPAQAGRLAPDLVLRVGDLPVSKPLREWLAGMPEVIQIAIDPEGTWQDPASALTESFGLEPAEAIRTLAAAGAAGAEEDWLPAWRAADERTAEAIGGVLAQEGLSEPRLGQELGVLLPAEATLFVASSMPVRDIETFWPARDDPPRVLCNRGANGIDGTVSSAFGAAAAGDGPVVLLIGDVALAHDIGGLLAARRLGLKLTVVLVENGGGGIFDFLPVSAAPMARAPERHPDGLEDPGRAGEDVFTRHVSTPTGLDFAGAGALYGLEHRLVEDVGALRGALESALAGERSQIIEVRSSRAQNVALHRRIWAAVAAALSPPAGAAAPPA
jgi:2-succinyl-5-enolpyruvyl-6-hydroxy-3-cyclohexene-1-carboxylate synthase